MKKFIFLMGFIFFGLTAFAQQGGMTKADLESEEKAIRDISKNWLEMEKKNNVAGIVELFADDAVLFRPNGEPVKGHDAIRKHFTVSNEQNPEEEVDWKTDRVEIASSGDLAVEYGKFDVKKTGPDGKGTDEGVYMTVFRKEAGKWKITADMVNSTKSEDPLK
jgi:uncharacterized protein (TIGR02246 family)